MKTFNKIIWGLASMLLFIACSDFEDINHDPTKVDKDKVKSYYLLNRSIVFAQQNPHIAERVFVIEWKSAARFDRANGLVNGNRYNDYNTDYLSTDYGVGWLNDVNMAINLSEERVAAPNPESYENNVLQMSRIWRAYLISEFADCFGPISPINKYDGVLDYKSVEDLYYFILDELKDAVAKIDTKDGLMSEISSTGTDKFYGGNMEKWIKFANSLRLRYAMRMSGVEPEKARTIVEELAKENKLITSIGDIAQVQEVDGWNELAGVMSRAWNMQALSVTLNNLMIGLGGIEFRVPEAIATQVNLKDARYDMGLYLPEHIADKTNAPGAGFFFDGLPKYIDPRATELYHIPGYDDGVHYFSNVNLADEARLVDLDYYKNPDKYKEPVYVKTLKTKYTWNTWVAGNWDYKSTISSELLQSRTFPSLSKKYRMSTNKRVFFGHWETYFLLAEAALNGWNVGTDKELYEKGITASFEYHGLSLYASQYIASKEYNRIGTSVAYDHTTEASSHEVSYVDGYTNEKKTKTYEYPKNSIYKNGTVNNDKLTKIITQKYLAQVPYLPLEAWSDHRRLGLPFFENPAAETDFNIQNYQIPLTNKNYMECNWSFYQERFMYPETMTINSKDSYQTAVKLLGGDDTLYTPLWWTGRKKGN